MSAKRAFLLRLSFALLLAWSFMVAQQQAVAHALAHDFERIHSSRIDAHSKDVTDHDEAFCAKCLAIAHLDHASGTTGLQFVPAAYAPPRCAPTIRESASLAVVTVYRSRAPPIFS
jgi:hypothetical protein